MIKNLLFLAHIFLFTQFAFSQENELSFSSITSEDGLSNNTIRSLLQDHKGFIWIGTDDGLNRYDGYELLAFRNNPNDSTSISSNTIYRILEDSLNRLWIAGNAGIDVYSPETMTFRHVPILEDGDSIYYDSYTRAIENNAGNIYIANTNGIYKYNDVSQVFEKFHIEVPTYGRSQQNGIRAMLIDRHNRIWIGSVGYGLFAVDLNTQEIILSPEKSKLFSFSNRIFAIAEDENGDIWLGADKGVYIVKSDLSELFPLSEDLEYPSVPIENIQKIEFHGEDVWIGTDSQGLFRYNRNHHSVKMYQHEKRNQKSLSNNSIRAIMFDSEDLLWVGTQYGAVNYCQLNRTKKFLLLKNETGNPNALSYNTVTSIYKDSHNNLWIGTDGGGLDHYSSDLKKIRNYKYEPGSKFSINTNAVLAIDEDSKGRIWVGGYRMGLNVIDPITNKIKSYRHDPDNENSISSDDVWDIYINEKDIMWIATNGGGLNRYDINSGRFTHYKEGDDNSIVINWCIKIYPDRLGNLWIGTYYGFSIFDPEKETFKNYVGENGTEGPSNNWIYGFAEDSLGNMWIGTANGLNYFQRKTGTFEVFDQKNGLPNEVINGILTDSHQNVWLSTNKGLAKFDPKKNKAWRYNRNDGLQGEQFIHGACFKSNEGEMFFGGVDGLNFFFPDSIGINLYEPPVHLTNLLLNFKETEIGGKNSPLKKSIGETETLTLTHHQSTFSLEYAALNYINPEKNQFAYRLEPYDDNWNYVGARREATYTNLDPGTYTFRVIASNNDGVWNDEGTSLTIRVLPVWWETLVFKILVIVLIILAALFIYMMRIRTLKMQKIYLEEEVENRTSIIKEKNSLLREQATQLNESNVLLEEQQQQIQEQNEVLLDQTYELETANKSLKELNSTKDKFFSIIAHDLKNPFGVIRGFAEIIRDKYSKLDDNSKKKYINAICDASSNVYNLLENLLNWSRSQTDRIEISPEQIHLLSLFENNIELVNEMLNSKQLDVRLNISDDIKAFADINMINTVVRNLLTNAIKFSPANKTISVLVENTGDLIQVEIKDEGVGISEANLKKLFRVDQNISSQGTNGESGTGLGLILCKEYVEKNKGRIWVKSAEGSGSTFYFTLPLYNSGDRRVKLPKSRKNKVSNQI